MPTIAFFYGITIYMYWRDHNPPHLHALYQDLEVLIDIRDGAILGGRMPQPVLRMLRVWIARHREELMENWLRAQRREPLFKVPGPDYND